MSRISNRIATIGAALAIVLLVILLVTLWSEVRNVARINDFGRIQDNLTAAHAINEMQEKQASLHVTTTHLIATFQQESDEMIRQNFTNEGKSFL